MPLTDNEDLKKYQTLKPDLQMNFIVRLIMKNLENGVG